MCYAPRARYDYELGIQRGEESVKRVLHALSSTDEWGNPLVTAYTSFDEMARWGFEDMNGIDLVGSLNAPLSEMLETDWMGFQVKSSPCGTQRFVRKAELLGQKNAHIHRAKPTFKVVLLNGQQDPYHIIRDCALGFIGYVGITPNPDDYEVKELLTEGFHPAMVEYTLDHLRDLRSRGYQGWEDPSGVIQGTVVRLPVKNQMRQRYH